MSGGSVPVQPYRIDEAIEYIQEIIDTNGDDSVDDDGDRKFTDYSEETIEKFREAVQVLKKARIALNRIDYLFCSDDSERSFHERWEEEMEGLNEKTDNRN